MKLRGRKERVGWWLGGAQSASKLENKNQRQRDALTEGKEKKILGEKGRQKRRARPDPTENLQIRRKGKRRI